MKERPVPFSAAMVLALLEGRKTRTRRLVREQERLRMGEGCLRGEVAANYLNEWGSWQPWVPNAKTLPCPYGVPGDRLWVREAIQFDVKWNMVPPRDVPAGSAVWYPASCTAANAPRSGAFLIGKRRPPMFMPRWCSRITLEVTGVRVERLQDISEEDAIAEGVEPIETQLCYSVMHEDGSTGTVFVEPAVGARNVAAWRRMDPTPLRSARVGFEMLWDSLNAKRAPWASNPWVFVIEFKRLEEARRAA